MMMNMFSNFDIYHMNIKLPMSWFMSTTIILTLLFKMKNNLNLMKTMSMMMINMNKMNNNNKTKPILFNSLMIILITMNLMNIIPYLTALSPNMMFTLSMSMMMWSSNFMFMLLNNLNIFMMNLTPTNTPTYLTLIINSIELNSFMFQIISLSMRLMINMMMGHIIMMIMNKFYFIYMYMIMEMFIIMIQSYVFYMLNMMNFNNSY